MFIEKEYPEISNSIAYILVSIKQFISAVERPKMRSILCVTQQLLLDGWTDWHETLGIYITRLGLLHGVLFHFRSEPRNRKCGCFRKPEVGTGSWKYSRWKENKILGQKYYSTFLIFWPGEASESSKDFFFPCKSIWASHIKCSAS